MSRSIMILVTDNHEIADQAKKLCEGQNATCQVYSPVQWREGLDNAFFRQQLLNGVPSLSAGQATVSHYDGNVVPFPTASSSSSINVQKMDEIEAHAIENAIVQYKGNLTEAAKALGIGRATLYRKVKQYHIDPSVARKKRTAA